VVPERRAEEDGPRRLRAEPDVNAAALSGEVVAGAEVLEQAVLEPRRPPVIDVYSRPLDGSGSGDVVAEDGPAEDGAAPEDEHGLPRVVLEEGVLDEARAPVGEGERVPPVP